MFPIAVCLEGRFEQGTFGVDCKGDVECLSSFPKVRMPIPSLPCALLSGERQDGLSSCVLASG